MVKRRSLTPLSGKDGELHATRRASGGARREVTDRVVLRRAGAELMGWALNMSRGGIRIIVEDPVDLGQEYEVELGTDDPDTPKRLGRVVWVQEEKDGMVVGVEFVPKEGAESPAA